MSLQIDFFGELTDITNTNSLYFPIEGGTLLKEILNELHTKFPGIAEIGYSIFHNNTQVSDVDTMLQDNEKISIMPAFAGG